MTGSTIPFIGKHNLSNLLIHSDPGGRSGFIAAWLTGQLTTLAFDSGANLQLEYTKIHKLENVDTIKNHPGIKIRVRPEITTIDLHSLLFLRKNVYTQIPNFLHSEYSLTTFTKLTRFSNEIFEWDHELDYSLYDVVLNFSDTFDNNYMINLYRNIVGKNPAPELINMLIKTNELNQIPIDLNHACSVLKLCLTQEYTLGLKEEHRIWSIVDIYNSTPIDQLYATVLQSIVPENYIRRLT
jgi:hypothetical protein